jgi:hypothetical protein
MDVQVNERLMKKQKMMEITKDTHAIDGNVDPDFVTIPKIYLENAGLVKNDVVLYCRPMLRLQIQFLKERVMAKNLRGIIVGPPGTGKSVCTLAFMASLNRDDWQVIWIHLSQFTNSCLTLQPNTCTYGIGNDYVLLLIIESDLCAWTALPIILTMNSFLIPCLVSSRKRIDLSFSHLWVLLVKEILTTINSTLLKDTA